MCDTIHSLAHVGAHRTSDGLAHRPNCRADHDHPEPLGNTDGRPHGTHPSPQVHKKGGLTGKKDRGTARSRVVSNPATERGPMLLNFSKWTG